MSLEDDVQAMFPKAQFTISFDKDTLDSELSSSNMIFIVIKHKCYCFGNTAVPNDYIQVKKRHDARYISYADAINAMIEYDYEPCSHCFLEEFEQSKNSQIQYIAHFGS